MQAKPASTIISLVTQVSKTKCINWTVHDVRVKNREQNVANSPSLIGASVFGRGGGGEGGKESSGRT